jgi:endonuclease/exonuclease/phosphatase family metal-dependent hydrolase
MRILFWNVDCGTQKGVVEKVRWFAERCDILCLQEVNHLYTRQSGSGAVRVRPTKGKTAQEHDLQLFVRLRRALEQTHVGFYTPNMRGMHDLERSHLLFDYGLATFFRLGVRPETWHEGTLHRQFGATNDGKPSSRKIVSFTASQDGKRYLIGHSHFLWDPRGKIDTPERMLQSNRTNAHLQHHHVTERWGQELRVIFGGDFNLTSELHAFRKLVKSRVYGRKGARVLNHEFGVTDTRTDSYTKSVREADFVLVSDSVKAELRVDYDVPSDHAALIVTIDES